MAAPPVQGCPLEGALGSLRCWGVWRYSPSPECDPKGALGMLAQELGRRTFSGDRGESTSQAGLRFGNKSPGGEDFQKAVFSSAHFQMAQNRSE